MAQFDDIHMHDELSQIVGREVDIIDRSVIESGSNRYICAELLGTAEAFMRGDDAHLFDIVEASDRIVEYTPVLANGPRQSE